MIYIKRDLEESLKKIVNEGKEFVVVTGPRRSGKTTMIEHFLIGCNKSKIEVTFEIRMYSRFSTTI